MSACGLPPGAVPAPTPQRGQPGNFTRARLVRKTSSFIEWAAGRLCLGEELKASARQKTENLLLWQSEAADPPAVADGQADIYWGRSWK
jgi:hypothetical protein